MLPYDIESYPNFWCFCAKSRVTGKRYFFEISERRDDRQLLGEFVSGMSQQEMYGVGYNNIEYDYPVIHHILNGMDPYEANLKVFNAPRFQSRVKDPYFKQIDLYTIMHFDNLAKATSLKQLEFVMRSPNIQDLPYPPGVPLTHEQMDHVIEYCFNDVDETDKFLDEVMEEVEFRISLDDPWLLNANSTKIGESTLINEIGRQYCYRNGEKIQTHREFINLADCMLPIQFENIELEKVRCYLQAQTIKETKGVFDGLSAVVKDFQLDFGTGGIHGSRHFEKFFSNDKYTIVDVDVTSYYPSLAIVNNFEPEHLAGRFRDAYAGLKEKRLQYAKGTILNALYKLALNGAYGKSKSQYSPLYDPKFTMQITINGQLLLCLLFERLMKINLVEPIQINTDGLTCYVRNTKIDEFMAVCAQWEKETGLDLERTDYSAMWIRDVNNYIAQKTDGKLKMKGCYEVEKDWHKSHDSLIIPKAARDYMVHGTNYIQTILDCKDPYDFCNFVKSNKTIHIDDQEIQRRSRYYVSTNGGTGIKTLKNGGRFNIMKDRLITECNNMVKFDWSTVDYDHYIKEVEKIIV